jgi:hypothetical protein
VRESERDGDGERVCVFVCERVRGGRGEKKKIDNRFNAFSEDFRDVVLNPECSDGSLA